MDAILIQYLLNWVVLGCIYALVAIGFSLLFGVLDVIHFSHGDVSIVAPFVTLAVLQALLGTSLAAGGIAVLILACAAAILAVGLLGILLEWLVIRRFRGAPAMMALVATVALGTVIRELIRSIYPQGSNPKPFPSLLTSRLTVGDITIPYYSLFVIAVAVLLVGLLFTIMRYTKIGVRIRAAAEDRDIARLMAINPEHVFAATFFIASAVGAVGGILYASYAGVVRFDFGIQLGLIGFSAAVIGGLGSMPGAILGSLLIAGIETLVQATMAEGASYRIVFVFLLVILVLVLKPSGVFGKPVVEKV
ncbi:branched-chain amino acid ABC transporter permease [Phaeovulum sp.]|uniref:branched-chain amino acid ABC transporter permease n=1 Tax=Phaeovulum sp. TaxID=2934796 RepID=UPI0039E3280E